MLGHRQLSAAEYLGIWRRRWKWALLPVLFGAAAGYLLARVVPARYTSTAVLEENTRGAADVILPETEFTAARVSALRQQALTRDRLEGLASRFSLYVAEKNGPAGAGASAQMEKDIVVSPSAGGFAVSFTAGSPRTAQQVCAELVSLLRQEEAKNIQRDAAQRPAAASDPVAEYLATQVADAKRILDDREAALAEFRRQHSGDLAGAGRNEAERTIAEDQAQLQVTDAALKHALQQRTALTETLFAQKSPASESTKSPGTPATEALEQELAAEQAQLATLEARYTADHPDVVKLKSDIAQLRKKIAEAKKGASENAGKKPDAAGTAGSPQTAQIQAQIHELDAQIQERTREQGRLQQEILTARARLDTKSMLGQEYRELTAQAATARSLYTNLLARQNEAQKAGPSEARRQQELVRVAVPPNLPERAVYPDPTVFTLGGAGAGLAIGLLGIVAGEMRDKSLRTEGDVEYFLELPTLAVIPAAGKKDGNGAAGDADSRGGRTGNRGEKEEGVLADV